MKKPQKRGAPSSRGPRRAALVVVGLVLLVVTIRGLRKDAPAPLASSPQVPGSGPDAPRASNVAPSGAPPGPSGSVAIEDPFGGPGSVPENVGARMPPAVSPYPPGSQPLTEGVDPATTMKEDDPVDAPTGIHVVFGSRVQVVHPPDPLIIDLVVMNKLGAHLPITRGVARFRADKSTIEAGPWFSTPLVDDGSGSDLAAGDHEYTATYRPSEPERAAFFKGGSHVFVEVAFDAPNGLGARRYSAVMMYSPLPNVEINGKYTEGATKGSLVIGVGVKVKKAGEYRLVASLYGPGGETAIAFAAKTLQLSVSDDATIPLLFFGKILHDRGIDGPYELRYMMAFERSTETQDEIPGVTVDHAFTTKAYTAKSFSEDPYVAPSPDFPHVDQDSPSQKNKPPPLYSGKDRPARRQ